MFKWATFREILLPSSGNVNDYVAHIYFKYARHNHLLRSSFSRLDEDPSPEFKQKVNNWLDI